MITLLHSESVGRVKFVVVRTGSSGPGIIPTLQLMNGTVREVDNVEFAVKDNNSIAFGELLRRQLVEVRIIKCTTHITTHTNTASWTPDNFAAYSQ